MIDGATYLFAAGRSDSGVSVFSIGSDGTLSNVANVSDDDVLELSGASGVTTAELGGTTYLFVAGAGDNGITVFSVDEDGIMEFASSIRNKDTLALDNVSSLSVEVIEGTTYIFANGQESENGVSMFAVDGDGSLTPTAGINDPGSSALQGAQALTTAQIDGTTYVFVSGADNPGLSVVSVGPPALALVDGSDTGVSDDDVTFDTTPTIAFQVQKGARLRIDWDDGHGPVAVEPGTGFLQEFTKDVAYETGGLKTITVDARDSDGATATVELAIEIEANPSAAMPIALMTTGSPRPSRRP